MRLGTKPTAREGNYIYMIVGIILLSLGGYVQNRELYTGLLITQYVLILLPPIIFLKIKGYSLKENLRLNKTTWKNIILSIFIVIFSYPIVVFFNFLGISFLERFGTTLANPIPLAKTSDILLKQLFIIAISPGICEEIMFRGFLLSSYENLGENKAILYSAILFGVFHFNLQNLLGPIILGIIFGIMVFKTDSILVSIVGHTTNNLIAIVLGYILHKTEMAELGNVVSEAGNVVSQEPNFIMMVLSLGVVALLCGVIVSTLIKQLDEGDRNKKKNLIEINENNILLIREVEDINIVTLLPIIMTLAVYAVISYRVFFTG